MARNGVPPGVPFVWEQAERRLEAQVRQADALDTKAGALVGLHALAGGLLATFANHASRSVRWIAVGVIVELVVSGSLAFMGYRVEAYVRDPSAEDLWEFGSWEPEQIQYRLLSMRFQSLRANDRRLLRKARYVAWSLTGLAVVAFVVAASAIGGLAVYR